MSSIRLSTPHVKSLRSLSNSTGPHARQSSAFFFLLYVFAIACAPIVGQQKAGPQKLPSVDDIVEGYLKAIGGKKRLAATKDATYEWTIQLKDQAIGIAKTYLKQPSSVRTELIFGNGQIVAVANPGSAWERGLKGELRTLTAAEAAAAKLQALLDATHLVDFKKYDVVARVVSLSEVSGEPAYVVEFSTRSGARLRYSFSQKTKLLTTIEDDARRSVTRFDDYRLNEAILLPYRTRVSVGNTGELVFVLNKARFNTGINNGLFEQRSNE